MPAHRGPCDEEELPSRDREGLARKRPKGVWFLDTEREKYFEEEEAVVSHSKCFYKNVFICKWVVIVFLFAYALIASLKPEIIIGTCWKVVFGNFPSLEKRFKEATLFVVF